MTTISIGAPASGPGGAGGGGGAPARIEIDPFDTPPTPARPVIASARASLLRRIGAIGDESLKLLDELPPNENPLEILSGIGALAGKGLAAIHGLSAAKGVIAAAGTVRGLGNIGSHGIVDAGTALRSGMEWLGPGYKEIAPGVFRSSDGLRQFRMTTADLVPTHGNIGSHVHFEALDSLGKVIENLHLPVTR